MMRYQQKVHWRGGDIERTIWLLGADVPRNEYYRLHQIAQQAHNLNPYPRLVKRQSVVPQIAIRKDT